mgnify:FL=1
MNFFKKFLENASNNNLSRKQGEDTWDKWIREDKEKKLEEEKKIQEQKQLQEEAEKKRLEAITPEEIEAEKNKIKEVANNWCSYLISQFKEHRFVLYQEWQNSFTRDLYGNEESDFFDWEELLQEPLPIDENTDGFNRGFNYFLKNVMFRDMDSFDFLSGWENYQKAYNPKDEDGNLIDDMWTFISSQFFIVMGETDKQLQLNEEERIAAGFSDEMSGEDYEIYCKNILIEAGWNMEQTSKTNDQGVDLIGYICDFKICIQCKRYSNPVGNKAVQEIIAGKQFYGGTHAVVVSNAGFTKSAETLAAKTGVILISDIELEKLEDYIE